MLAGFNEGWIDFEGRKEDIVKGVVPLATVLNDLVRGA
jgi:hypothetical protein